MNRFRDQLLGIKRFTCVTDYQRGGSSGIIKGTVTVEQTDNQFILTERGRWQDNQITTTNVYHWQLHSDQLIVSHLRYGEDQPVRLCQLKPVENGYDTEQGHQCGDDFYQATIRLEPELTLQWRVTGPDKDGWIETCYM